MKKLFMLFLFCCFPLFVEARVDYDITNYFIDATILEDGDVSVKELIVLDGTFNGYIRDIVYKNDKLKYQESQDFSQSAIYNASGFKNISIYAKKFSKEELSFDTFNESFTKLTKAYYEEDAMNGEFIESGIQNGKSYKMYYKSDNDVVGFLIEYTLEDVVVLHEDVAELYWTFLGSDFDDPIYDLQIKVHLPKEDSSGLFRAWAHGDLTGNIEFLDKQTLLATVNKVAANTAIDIRTTFDASLMNESLVSKKTNEVALDKIIDVEEERAKDANLLREKNARNLLIANTLCIIYIVVVLLWWIYVYIRYDREYKSTFNAKYNREFIEEYNVEVVDYLMNQTITPNAMSASILNLIYKKNIEVHEIPSKKKKEKNYEFVLKNRDKTTDTEDVLLDFLFETVGKENKFTTEKLKYYAAGTKTYSNFQKSYTNWQNCVRKEGEKQNFFEKNGLPIVSSIFLLLAAIFIVFYVSYLKIDTFLVLITMALSIVFLIYSLMIRKRTKKGNEDYVRWKAFKNFLEDFGRFDIKELPEIALWEKYLVYATVFGLADKVEKAMNVKIQEYPQGTVGVYYPTWVDFHIAHMVSHSINNSFTSNQTAITNSRIASSSRSSGGGFGGGFSSGGGFGGGGGGGRGF